MSVPDIDVERMKAAFAALTSIDTPTSRERTGVETGVSALIPRPSDGGDSLRPPPSPDTGGAHSDGEERVRHGGSLPLVQMVGTFEPESRLS